jgi:hypothetical protein
MEFGSYVLWPAVKAFAAKAALAFVLNIGLLFV